MNQNAMFQLTYGLFVLTTKENDKDNGCIINTAMQVTATPNRIAIAVNKNNFTHDIIKHTNQFNLCVLDESAPFSLYQHFGFVSGRDTNKFEKFAFERSKNQLAYLPRHCNAYISGEVIQTVDLGTHTLFIADVVEAEVLAEIASVTYAYYHKHIKPQPVSTKKQGYVCKICGYIYEGADLPEDYICPLCKHPASDFEKLK